MKRGPIKTKSFTILKSTTTSSSGASGIWESGNLGILPFGMGLEGKKTTTTKNKVFEQCGTEQLKKNQGLRLTLKAIMQLFKN